MTDGTRRRRRSIRLAGRDYAAPGVYFVTICAQTRGDILGAARGGEVALNAAGAMVRAYWLALPSRFAAVALDAWVVMPDHVHGLIDLRAAGGDHAGSPLRLGDIVGWFKTMTTNAYIRGVRDGRWPPFNGRLWQRNYYERIVRTDDALERVRAYIAQNPANHRRR